MRTYKTYFIAVIFLLVVACGKKLNVEPFVGPPEVETTELNRDLVEAEGKLLAAGRIVSEGDGIVEHGHIWSVDDPNLDITTGMKAVPGPVDEQGRYTSEVVLSVLNTNYYIRAYIKDVYDREFYGEVFTQFYGDGPHADFTYTVSNDTFAPSMVSFINNSSNYEIFEWDFGNGIKNDQEENPVVEYTIPGQYQVILRVTGERGEDRDTQYIDIKFRQFEVHRTGLGEAEEVLALPDGGYIATGTVVNPSNGQSDIYVIRLEADGEQGENGFEKTYPHPGFDFAQDIIPVNDDFIIIGYTNTVDETQRDILYLWIGPDGTKKMGPLALSTPDREDYDDLATCATLSPPGDGRILIAGHGKRVDGTGDKDFFSILVSPDLSSSTGARRLAHQGIEEPNDVIRIGQDYYVTGKMIVDGEKDALFLRIGENGQSVSGFIGLGGTESDEGQAIKEGPNGDIWIGGFSSSSSSGNKDIYLVRTDQNGQGAVENFVDDGGSEEANDFTILDSGQAVFVGEKDDKPLMLKWTAGNSADWSEDFDQDNGYLNSVRTTSDGGYVAAGRNSTGFYLVRTNNLGKVK